MMGIMCSIFAVRVCSAVTLKSTSASIVPSMAFSQDTGPGKEEVLCIHRSELGIVAGIAQHEQVAVMLDYCCGHEMRVAIVPLRVLEDQVDHVLDTLRNNSVASLWAGNPCHPVH